MMEAEAAILDLLSKRAPGATFCPSEAARAMASEDWRRRMDEVRAAGARLAAEGRLSVLQSGEPVDPSTATGPIRYGAPR